MSDIIRQAYHRRNRRYRSSRHPDKNKEAGLGLLKKLSKTLQKFITNILKSSTVPLVHLHKSSSDTFLAEKYHTWQIPKN